MLVEIKIRLIDNIFYTGFETLLYTHISLQRPKSSFMCCTECIITTYKIFKYQNINQYEVTKKKALFTLKASFILIFREKYWKEGMGFDKYDNLKSFDN